MRAPLSKALTLAKSLSRTESLFLGALFVFLALHFYLGVYVPRDPSYRQFKSVSFLELPGVSSAETVNSLLREWTPAVEAPKLQPPDLFLRGVVVQKGVGKAAISIVPHDGRPARLAWVAAGDAVEDWQVSTVGRNEVLLTRGEERREIKLFVRD